MGHPLLLQKETKMAQKETKWPECYTVLLSVVLPNSISKGTGNNHRLNMM